jgi:hypothetical protein
MLLQSFNGDRRDGHASDTVGGLPCFADEHCGVVRPLIVGPDNRPPYIQDAGFLVVVAPPEGADFAGA